MSTITECDDEFARANEHATCCREQVWNWLNEAPDGGIHLRYALLEEVFHFAAYRDANGSSGVVDYMVSVVPNIAEYAKAHQASIVAKSALQ
jgi:hypothetical protein